MKRIALRLALLVAVLIRLMGSIPAMKTWLMAWPEGRVRKACSFLVCVALLCLVGRPDVARAAQGETFEVDSALPLVATGLFVEEGAHGFSAAVSDVLELLDELDRLVAERGP